MPGNLKYAPYDTSRRSQPAAGAIPMRLGSSLPVAGCSSGAIAIPGLIVIGLDVVRHILDFAKFGKDAAYHAWSSKVWGLSLALALVLLMGFGVVEPFVASTVVLGLIAQVEGLLISVVLPVWTHDVPTVIHALRIRRSHAGIAPGGKQRPS